jgi:hypothetical protein
MVESITPVVYGGRGRWVRALALHVLGATLIAVVFGAAVGGVGALLGAPFGRAGLVAVAAVAALYALGTLPRLSVPVPQLRRQVPDWWRTFFSPSVTAFLYGAGLGIGFLTFLATGTLVVVTAAAFASGSPALGAVLIAPFGLARGMSAIVAANVVSDEDAPRLIDRLTGASDAWRRVAAGLALSAVAVVAVAAAASQVGGWGSLASAVLAVTFAWAAASKLAGRRRWHRSLAAHRLPAAVERAARWVTPAAEAVVPMLALLGLRRASAAWAIALLVVFTVAVLRIRLRVGARVPCGCFGGRREIDASAALARNAMLALVGVVALRTGDAPLVAWPGSPSGADILPAVLATASVVIAAAAVWQATTWLGRRA